MIRRWLIGVGISIGVAAPSHALSPGVDCDCPAAGAWRAPTALVAPAAAKRSGLSPAEAFVQAQQPPQAGDPPLLELWRRPSDERLLSERDARFRFGPNDSSVLVWSDLTTSPTVRLVDVSASPATAPLTLWSQRLDGQGSWLRFSPAGNVLMVVVLRGAQLSIDIIDSQSGRVIHRALVTPFGVPSVQDGELRIGADLSASPLGGVGVPLGENRLVYGMRTSATMARWTLVDLDSGATGSVDTALAQARTSASLCGDRVAILSSSQQTPNITDVTILSPFAASPPALTLPAGVVTIATEGHQHRATAGVSTKLLAPNDAADACPSNLAPASDFDSSTEGPLALRLEDRSTSTPHALENWEWSFGDGTTSSDPHPTHTFPVPGTYRVTLTIRNAAGGVATRARDLLACGAPSRLAGKILYGVADKPPLEPTTELLLRNLPQKSDVSLMLRQPYHSLPTPVLSFDGERLAFGGDFLGRSGIFTSGADAAAIESITNPELQGDESPAWAPDRSRILFARGRWENGYNVYRAWYVVAPDGSGLTPVSALGADVRKVSFSPTLADKPECRSEPTKNRPLSCYTVAFDSGRLYELAVGTIGLDGSAPRRVGLISADDVVFSPDGKRIAYTAIWARVGDRSFVSVVVARADGSNPRILAPAGSFDDSSPTWAPDGSSLAVLRTPLTRAANRYEYGSAQVVVVDEAGCNPRSVISNPEGSISLLGWAPGQTVPGSITLAGTVRLLSVPRLPSTQPEVSIRLSSGEIVRETHPDAAGGFAFSGLERDRNYALTVIPPRGWLALIDYLPAPSTISVTSATTRLDVVSWSIAPESFELRGVARNDSSEPVSGARVRASWDGGFLEARTGADGSYALHPPPLKDIKVEIWKAGSAAVAPQTVRGYYGGDYHLDLHLHEFTGGLLAESRRVADMQYDLFLTDGHGSSIRWLTQSPANETGPAWSADGSQLAFASDEDGPAGQVYVMRADGSGRHSIAGARGYAPTWSPDGTAIAYASAEGLRIARTDGSGVRELTSPYVDRDPDWSPDGTHIVFVRPWRFPLGRTEEQIYSIRPDGSNLTRLEAEDGQDYQPAWSPDGATLAFASTRSGTPAIYSADPDGSNVKQLLEGAEKPTWGPPGAGLYFQYAAGYPRFGWPTPGEDFIQSLYGGTEVDWAPSPSSPDVDGDGVADADDACPQQADSQQNDGDFDGRGDLCDDCTEIWNPDQRDRDADGYGDACDADIDGDGMVNFADLARLKAKFFTADSSADLDGDGVVNFRDLSRLKASFLRAPGPSGVRH